MEEDIPLFICTNQERVLEIVGATPLPSKQGHFRPGSRCSSRFQNISKNRDILSPQLSGCSLANTAQCHWPVSLDEHVADSCSLAHPDPHLPLYKCPFWPVVPSLGCVRLFCLRCIPLHWHQNPLCRVSSSTNIRQKGWPCGFYSYVHYNCSKLLMFSLSKVSKCVKLICPGK